MSPEEARQRGRLGALAKHARHNPDEDAAKARAAFDQRFLDEVDPDRLLPDEERVRRAKYARRLFYARLSAAGVAARRRKAAAS